MVIKDSKGITDPQHLKYLYELMYKVHNIFMEYGVQYSVNGGTLLGAVRHGGIIPWDEDIDIEINESYVPILKGKKMRTIFKKAGLKLLSHPEGWYKVKDLKNNIKDFDIFITRMAIKDGVPVVTLTGGAEKIWPKQYFTADEMFPLKLYKFGKIKVLGPNSPEKHLDRLYGKSWKKIGYITMDSEHMMLDKPIKVPVKRFVAGKDYYIPTKPQIIPKKSDILLQRCYYNCGPEFIKKFYKL